MTLSDYEVKELSAIDFKDINAGESLWYWISYGVGAAVRSLVDGTKMVASIHV